MMISVVFGGLILLFIALYYSIVGLVIINAFFIPTLVW